MPHSHARPRTKNIKKRLVIAGAAGLVTATAAVVGVQAYGGETEVAAADAPVGTLPIGEPANGASRSADRELLPTAETAAQLAQAADDLREQEEKAARKAAEKAAKEQAIEEARKDPRAAARAMLADFGWGQDQFPCLDALWGRESGWRYQAENPSSGAYGIPQSLPGSKMGTVADDWRDNPLTQIRWGLQYIQGSYGSPCGADSHSRDVGHY